MTKRLDTSPLIDWAVAGVPLVMGTESGDLHIVAAFDGGVLVGAIDGLGHGPEAAVAARAAATILEAHAGESLLRLMESCHAGLRQTRGAVITLASFDGRTARMTWSGVGNVEGALLRFESSSVVDVAPLRGGIVGLRLPSPRQATISVSPGDTLILVTDGIASGFARGLSTTASPAQVAESILGQHRKNSDDAMVVVARWVGASA